MPPKTPSSKRSPAQAPPPRPPAKPLPQLSKSRFMAGWQCHKRLWLQLFQPDLAAEPDAATQARFDQGTAVGEVARGFVPGGTLVDAEYYAHDAAMAHTRRLLADPGVPALYEAAFRHDDVRVRADILARNGDGSFDLLEVKSSTRAKDEHAWDVAVQAHVLRGAGLPLRRMGLLHIDTGYVYPGGEHDPQGLFARADLTAEVEALLPEIPERLAAMRTALRGKAPPEVAPGEQCFAPYECPFTGACIAPAPPHTVGELYRSGRALRGRLAADGITMIAEIPPDYGLSPLQARQRAAVATGEPYEDSRVRDVLAGLERPLYFLDFETFNPALPLYPGTRPYQQVPFQWSLHRLDADGSLAHAEYLHDGADDPRPGLTAALLAGLGGDGPICVYSSFERTQLRGLGSALPQHADALAQIEGRLVDLLPLVRERIYHPEFRGSFSIKSVLPALVPTMDYAGMDISDGSSASAAYLGLATGQCPAAEKAGVRGDLLAYCARDTEAMVALYRRLSGWG